MVENSGPLYLLARPNLRGKKSNKNGMVAMKIPGTIIFPGILPCSKHIKGLI